MLLYILICTLQVCTGRNKLVEGEVAVQRPSSGEGDEEIMNSFLFRFETFGEEPLFKDKDKKMIREVISHISENVPCIKFR